MVQVFDRSVRAQGAHIRRKANLVPSVSTTPTQDSEGTEVWPSVMENIYPRNDDESTKGEKALAVIVVLLALTILGFAAWRVGKWRRRKALEKVASNQVDFAFADQKREEMAAFYIDFDGSGRTMEKPPLKVNMPATPAASMKRMSTKGPWTRIIPGSLPSGKNNHLFAQISRPRAQPLCDSPPSYIAASANKRSGPPTLTIPPQSDSANRLGPSPRSSSFGPDSPLYKTPGKDLKHKSFLGSKPLPRLMTVQSTFKPSLTDELLVSLGEKLKMLEEYEDEWCLVQRIGGDMQKGVVPRFCLREQA